jgi:photosystem II stability/assembly factor-like uncharacterized protein
MKKILFTLFIIHCSLLIANAQWYQQNSGTTSALYDVHFINQYTGWASGMGCILKTTNSGTNWISQNIPITNEYLMGIHPIDSSLVYCVGYDETFLKTTNGGINWIVLRSGAYGNSHAFLGVFFINPTTGWICGSGQYVYKTTNGGISLDDSSYTNGSWYWDIYFKDALTGVMCGQGAEVFKTTNGGINWIQVPVPNGGSLGIFHKISFINNLYGWIVGTDRKVYRTTNFGSSWDSIATVIGAVNCQSSYFSSMNTGYVGCVNNPPMLFKTTNGGFNWVVQNNYPTNGFVGSIIFLNDYTGWTVGGGGNIRYTTNGGLTFISGNGEIKTKEFELEQNYPNPFNLRTNIEFKLIKNDFYSLEIFNIEGKRIEIIFSEFKQEGNFSINYDAKKLSSGIYFYKLSSPDVSVVKKFILLK